MNQHSRCLLSSAMAALFIAAGCGGPDYPKTVEVTGTVTLDGEPVPKAIVTFMPTDGGRTATGYTDEDGEYSLTTYQDGDGAVPGSHKIAINSTEPPPMPGGGTTMGGEQPESPRNYTPPFPPKYGSPEKSGFTAEVTPDAENHFPLEMKTGG